MYRRKFIIGLMTTTALAACAEGMGPLKLLHNLVFAFVNVVGLLGNIIGLRPEEQKQIVAWLEQARGLLDLVIDTVTDSSKSAAQKILSLMLSVLNILAPLALNSPPFNTIIAAAKVMIPVIAGLFGIAVSQPTRLAPYPSMSETDAEAVLSHYAQ